MRTLLFIGLLLISVTSFSQSSLTVFNNGGQKFYLIMNGIKQNSVAQTNVVVSGVKNGGYSVKLIFEDGKTKDIDKNFYLDSPQDVTTKVTFKKGNGKLQLVSMVPAAGTVAAGSVTYRPDNNAAFSDAGTTTTTTTQTISTETTTLGNSTTSGNTGNGNGSAGIQINSNTTSPNSNSQQNSTNGGNGSISISVNDPNNGQNVNMGVNVNANGQGIDTSAQHFNMNVNVNVSGNGNIQNPDNTRPGNTNANVTVNGGTVNQNSTNTTVTTTTTTTTVSGTTNVNSTTGNNTGNTTSNNVVVSSNGRMTCTNTLSSVETLKTELNGYSFEDDRVEALKISLKTKCLYAADAVKLMDLFTYDANQLEVAKYLSDHLVDYDNASSLATKFTFDSSKMEYMNYIGRD